MQRNRMQFDSLDDIRAFSRDLPPGNTRFAEAAALRQQKLTKPPGSLGRLEELAIWLARWQGRELPRLERVTIAVFAGNHGVAERGVSAYPQAVTAQMVANFASGGAAINQIAKLAGADLRVVPIELERPTRDFTMASAMEPDEFLAAVDIGYRTVPEDCDLLAVGEMGIANTTTAAMLCAALLGGGGARWAGRGTGVDDGGLLRKRARRSMPRWIFTAAYQAIRWAWRQPSAAASLPQSPAPCSRREATISRCCSTASWRPPPCCRLRALTPARWIIAAPGMSPPNPATANSRSIRCSTSICGSAKPPARALRSCWRAPRSPVTPAWRLSPRPAFPARATEKALSGAPTLINSGEHRTQRSR
jgi:Phosphoribosyltransferase